MELNNQVLEYQYDMIRSFFKTTCEPFDDLEWDGKTLIIYLDDIAIEQYSYEDLKELIDNFE